MTDIKAHFDMHLRAAIDDATDKDLGSEEAAAMIKNLANLAAIRPSLVEPETDPEPVVPTTRAGKISARLAKVLDNETTRVFIKAGGALAGVAVVAYSTIHKDHVIERQAMAQANHDAR